jgi:1-acyl-sn-glycerol-3-phosphate acyltransferase
MIKAKHSRWMAWVFDLYLFIAFKRHFKSIEIIGEINDSGLPLLVIANHISWWDGFWILRLNKKKLHRRFHVMMLEEQLRENMFLRRLGAFSIKKRSRTIRETFQYASALMQNRNNLLLLFPQGEISSQYDFPVVFQKGWSRILDRVDNPVQIVFVVHLLDYNSSPRPCLRQYVMLHNQEKDSDCQQMQDHYNNFFNQCLAQQKSHK